MNPWYLRHVQSLTAQSGQEGAGFQREVSYLKLNNMYVEVYDGCGFTFYRREKWPNPPGIVAEYNGHLVLSLQVFEFG